MLDRPWVQSWDQFQLQFWSIGEGVKEVYQIYGGSVPIDDVLDFRKENPAEHRRYCVSVRRSVQELSHMPDEERKTAFEKRQSELDEIAKQLRKRARKAWKKPASFGLTVTGAVVTLATGNPLGAAIGISAALLGYQSPQKPEAGAFPTYSTPGSGSDSRQYKVRDKCPLQSMFADQDLRATRAYRLMSAGSFAFSIRATELWFLK
jgi:hypothetical protein